MNNVLYQKIIVPCSKAPDGDTPTILFVTTESNGHAVFIDSFDTGLFCLKYFPYYHSKEEVIEFGVRKAALMLRRFKKSKSPTVMP